MLILDGWRLEVRYDQGLHSSEAPGMRFTDAVLGWF